MLGNSTWFDCSHSERIEYDSIPYWCMTISAHSGTPFSPGTLIGAGPVVTGLVVDAGRTEKLQLAVVASAGLDRVG